MAEVLARTLSSAAPRVSRADVPPALADLIAAMLDGDPSRRPTLAAVRAVLVDPTGDHGVPPRPASRRTAPLVAAVVVAVALVGGVVAWIATRPDAAAEHSSGRGGRPTTTTTTVAPYVDGTDESARLAGQLDGVTSTAMRLLGSGTTELALPPNALFTPITAPRISSLPTRAPWRFANPSGTRSACTEYFPPTMTLTGFASQLLSDPTTTVLVAHYALAVPLQAAQMFHGRTIGIGVAPRSCRVVGLESRFDQRAAPHSVVPGWADELSSWSMRPPARGPLADKKDEQWGDEYLIRSGRSLWELLVLSTDPRVADSTVTAVLEAIGRANST
jgi:hypothetical protein